MEISQETQEKLQKIAKAIAEAWCKIKEWFTNFIRKNWEWLKTAAIKWYQFEEEKEVVVRQHYKRDFTRQKISH